MVVVEEVEEAAAEEEDVEVATVDLIVEEVHLVAVTDLQVAEEGVQVTGRVQYLAVAITTLPGVIAAIVAMKLSQLVLEMMMVAVVEVVDTVEVSEAVVIEVDSVGVVIEVEEEASGDEEATETGTEMVTLVAQ